MKKKNKDKIFVLDEKGYHLIIPAKSYFSFFENGQEFILYVETHLPVFINPIFDKIKILN